MKLSKNFSKNLSNNLSKNYSGEVETKKKERPIEKKQLNVAVPLAYYKILKKRAVDKDTSPSTEVTNALTLYLKKKDAMEIDEEVETVLLENVVMLFRKVLLAYLPSGVINEKTIRMTDINPKLVNPMIKLLKECFEHVSITDKVNIERLILSADGVAGFRDTMRKIGVDESEGNESDLEVEDDLEDSEEDTEEDIEDDD